MNQVGYEKQSLKRKYMYWNILHNNPTEKLRATDAQIHGK